MIERIVKFLFGRRTVVKCDRCWLIEECGAYFETGAPQYRSSQCPNRWRDAKLLHCG